LLGLVERVVAVLVDIAPMGLLEVLIPVVVVAQEVKVRLLAQRAAQEL
jgi:hypothetical protein